ncbi:MAG: COX15/CtaA family protein [Hyphomicrobiaceae bacterium]
MASGRLGGRLSGGAVAAAEEVSAEPYGAVRLWLAIVILLVLAMVVVGGATRLTDSGLSITEWQPILGAIPPLSDADWQVAFDKYKQIPEYHQINKGMSLDAFKAIFWWEWAHRFLGRFIGLAFALPLAGFWLAGRIPKGYGGGLLAVLALGGLQGAIGWYMVMSGLVDRVDVSHYRLALHLSTALLILAALTRLWLALGRRDGAINLATIGAGHLWAARTIAALIALQVVFGGFVAGLKAGLTYNTWPLMDGRLVPEGLATLSPWYMNFVENITTVQFIHRSLAYLILGAGLWHAVAVTRVTDDARAERSAWLLVVLLATQACLGVAILLVAEGTIPLHLGLAHQLGGALIVMAMVLHLHRIARAHG